MNALRRGLLEKALGGDIVSLKERLLQALALSPDNCDSLKQEVEDLFADVSVSDGSSANCSDSYFNKNAKNVSSKWIDYRLGYLLLRQFRKFAKPDSDGGYYGLSLVSNDSGKENYQSAFLLGDNGAGKSSLFDAIEYACTGRIGEAEYRNMKNLPWYYRHSKDCEPDVRLLMASGEYDLVASKFMEKSGLDVQRFFFSENSIYVLSTYMGNNTDQVDWVPFFCYMLGLEHTLGFLDVTYRTGASKLSLYDELVTKLKDIQNLLETKIDDERENVSEFISNATIQLTQSAKERMLTLQEILKDVYEHWEETGDVTEKLSELRKVIPNEITYIRTLNKFRDFVKKTSLFRNRDRGDVPPFKPLDVEKGGLQVNSEELKYRVLNMTEAISVMLQSSENDKIPFDQINVRVNNFLRLDTFRNLSSKQTEDLNIEELLDMLKRLKEGIEENLPSILQEYLDDDFKNTVIGTLQEKFIRKDEKLTFSSLSTGTVCGNYGIEVAVNGIPVNKYFNTFRFRLFCLCMLAAINFKTMLSERILFPFVFDDIFYANDYKNKAQLFKFFEVLSDAARKILGDSNKLQVIFFTHDEQFVSTLFRKKMPFSFVKMARLLDSGDVVTTGRKMDGKDITYHPLSKDFKRKIQYGK